jgi:hypothetical protein
MRLHTLLITSVAVVSGPACSNGGGSDGGSSSGSSSGNSSSSSSSGSSGTTAASSSSSSSSSSGTSSTSTAASSSSSGSTTTGASSSSGAALGLIGTWDLSTTPIGSSAIPSTVIVGQDSLTITSPSFSLTAQRASNVLTLDTDAGGDFGTTTCTQTAAGFDAGIVPFNLGGTWAIQIGPTGGSTELSCTLSVAGTEVDGTCDDWFNFTTAKNPNAQTPASSFGDFGGNWTNTWVWGEPDAGIYPCALGFAGNDINTCDGGASGAENFDGNPLAGITFTWDGANTVSGSAQGWAEFSATRQ